MKSLRGKSVLITGASSGIGRATAIELARAGMRVAISARSIERLEVLAKELGPQTVVVPADLTVAAEADTLVDAAAEQLGGLDVLFANAGIYVAGNIADGNPDEWDKLLALNVSAVFRVIHRAIPHLRRSGGGDIVVTSSISAHQAIHYEPVYSASKHAINAFLHGLRRQLIADNIRVGSIAPGTVLNELWGFTEPDVIDRKVASHEGLRSEDVAEAVLFTLTRPSHVVIRDMVILPQALDL
jgi:ribitol 2-dehydrogenase